MPYISGTSEERIKSIPDFDYINKTKRKPKEHAGIVYFSRQSLSSFCFISTLYLFIVSIYCASCFFRVLIVNINEDCKPHQHSKFVIFNWSVTQQWFQAILKHLILLKSMLPFFPTSFYADVRVGLKQAVALNQIFLTEI